MSSGPEEYLTPELAGQWLYPEKPDFWKTAPCWEIRDAALESSRDLERLSLWECILEFRLYQDFGITLLDENGKPRDLSALNL